MNNLFRPITAFLGALILTMALMPLVIFLSKKLKARQTILHYVDNHAKKSGTPTMGGIGFIIAIALASLLSSIGTSFTLNIIAVVVMVGFGVVGFLDDFIKIFFKQNKGLRAWQKIVFQVALSLVISFFAYYNDIVAGEIFIPFTLNRVSLGFWSIPLFVVIFIAFTNAVNLIDGLDGLASKVTIAYIVFNALLIFFVIFIRGGLNQQQQEEYLGLVTFSLAIVGALIGFMFFNGYPAKIFMGDTGSLALGGAVGALAVLSGLLLYSPIIGIMYVITCFSVILQVAYFKATKGKRIFLMSPYHHHLERKGLHENRIGNIYVVITAAVGSLMLLITLLVV